jgi:hypothetical protein
MEKVISIGDRKASKRKADLLEILDFIREGVESGDIEEFIAVSVDPDGHTELHACINDVLGGVGMLEVGKHILISQEA